jgi:hypothetical protein
MKLKNGNGSVVNSIINSGNTLNISENEFKKCIISLEDTSDISGTSGTEFGYGGAIYIKIEGGEILIENKFNSESETETFTFDGCKIMGIGDGYGGAIGIYLNDGINSANLKFSGTYFF